MKTKGETPRSPGGGGIQETWLVNGFRYYRVWGGGGEGPSGLVMRLIRRMKLTLRSNGRNAWQVRKECWGAEAEWLHGTGCNSNTHLGLPASGGQSLKGAHACERVSAHTCIW